MSVQIRLCRPYLKKITIKPQHACGAACYFCAPRQELYSDIRSRKSGNLTLQDWKVIFADAKMMGVEEICVSGGEPTLYKKIAELIEAIRNAGLRASINSNALLLGGKEEELLHAGLNEVCLSLYSVYSERHDAIKGRDGLWDSVVSSARKIVKLRDKEFSNFKIGFYFILLPNNYAEVDDMYEFSANMGLDYLFLSHLQGEFDRESLYLSKSDFAFIRENVFPRIKEKMKENEDSYDKNISFLDRFISVGDVDNYIPGHYLYNADQIYCNTPNEFCIILANGEVHACNMVEHSHQGVIGNIQKMPLAEIFNGERANEFRLSHHQACKYCTVPINIKIQLRGGESKWRVLKTE